MKTKTNFLSLKYKKFKIDSDNTDCNTLGIRDNR